MVMKPRLPDLRLATRLELLNMCLLGNVTNRLFTCPSTIGNDNYLMARNPVD